MIDALIASLHYCVAEQKQCDRTIWTIISVTIVLPFPQDYYASFHLFICLPFPFQITVTYYIQFIVYTNYLV